jgi:hypothetical protein
MSLVLFIFYLLLFYLFIVCIESVLYYKCAPPSINTLLFVIKYFGKITQR